MFLTHTQICRQALFISCPDTAGRPATIMAGAALTPASPSQPGFNELQTGLFVMQRVLAGLAVGFEVLHSTTPQICH
jgi:hypothetical protein